MKPLDRVNGGGSIEGVESHLVQRIMKAIPSVVIFDAAQMRSPSFSRPSSSITTINSPRDIADRASGMLSKVNGIGGPDKWVGADMNVEWM